MDQNMTVAVGPPPVEFEYRRLTREELDAILAYQTFMRAPSGNFEHIGLRGGGTVEPYYYDFHGISQPAPREADGHIKLPLIGGALSPFGNRPPQARAAKSGQP